jgi:hypothetical protein
MAFQELGSMQLCFNEAVFGIYANSESTKNKERSVHKETCREKVTGSTTHRTVLPMMKNHTCLLMTVTVMLYARFAMDVSQV